MTPRRLLFCVVVAVQFGVLSWPRSTKAAPLSRDEVDRFVRPLVEGEYCRGVVVGLIDEGGTRVLGYGTRAEGDGPPPDGDTVFEIGSVTKVFTSLLLADMVRRGEVALDDPLQKYLPDDVKVPKTGAQPITLAHLASHASGLPRMPDNMTPKDPANPYADYTVRQLYAFLAKCQPAREAGEGVEYSNLGAALLGHALSRRAHKEFAPLLDERLLKPLGMTDTAIPLSPSMKRRLAPGHGPDGEAAKNWDLATFAPAGGLRSTGNDMLKFLAANLRPDSAGALAEAIRATRVSRARADAANDIGLGWHIQVKDKLVWHNGQTGGYHSYVGILPDKGVGLVLLTNTATTQPDGTAMALLRRMGGQASDPPPLRTAVKVDPKVLEGYVGEYPLSPSFKLAVTREGGRLMCQATGQNKFRVYPASETEFYYRVVDARITFTRGADGKVTGLVLHQNGADLSGPKTK